jgi:hypothetical protein
MAGALAVQLLGCPETTAHPSIGLKIENFTGDAVRLHFLAG